MTIDMMISKKCYSKHKITLDGASPKKLGISITLKRRHEKKLKSQKKVLFLT